LRFELLEDRSLLATLPAGFTETVIASDLTSPITMDIEAGGRIWLAYQDGRIEVIENDALLPTPAIVLDADGSGERGLQGIELDPDFATTGHIYVYYTAARNQSGQLASHNRLSRLTVDPLTQNTILAGSEVILLELPEFSTLPGNTSPIWHMGGAIHFLPDETIAIQVGDHLNNSIVQNNNSPLGKVLRVNKDGSPTTSNPFYNSADTNPPGGDRTTWSTNPPGDTDWIDYVWASGLRNPFSGDVDSDTGRYFLGDVGEGSWEEVNDATNAGRNFGWPATEGMFNPATFPNFTNPFHAYSHAGGCAITGGAFYSPAIDAFPAQYHGKFFFSEFCGGTIRVIDPNNAASVETFGSGIAFPMNIEFAADGSMYFVERGAGAGGNPGIGTGKIVKVQYAASIPPQIVVQPENTLVSVGYDATFTVSAAGTPPLGFQWQRRAGAEMVDIPGATSSTLVLPDVSLADDGAEFRVIVTNSFGSATSMVAVLDVTSDTPPTPEIDLPAAGTTYRAGDTIQFAGHATDLEDGTLANAGLTWQVDFHHATHLHPFLPPTSGIGSGQFTVPTNSETSDDVWYRIRLIATDSAGLTTETFRDVFPVKSDFVVTNNLGGGDMLVDGQTKQAPHEVTGVVNVQRTLEAPLTQAVGGMVGVFRQWLDGDTNRLRTISTPEDDTNYVAIYEEFSSSMVFLSDLVPSNDPPPNGWGPIEYDTSNGEAAAGDGNPMSIGGVLYGKGLGVHAVSDVRYSLGGAFSRFVADVGVDDEKASGSVVFQVFGDGNLLFDSGTRLNDNNTTGQPLRVDVNVTGVNELRLAVGNAGNGNGEDHADWGNARLIPAGASSNIYINFQPAASPAVTGYLVDSGLVFGNRERGLMYGWSSAQAAVDRNASTADDLYETHITVGANQSWEIALANGTYAVTIAVGDAGPAAEQSTNTVNVEGVPYWSGEFFDNDVFGQQTRLITVSDGRLTMNVDSSTDTSINFIEIVPLPAIDPESNIFPFSGADVNLNGRLTMADALDLAAGWGTHDPGLDLEARVRLGDLDFDGDTDNDDWTVFHAQWIAEGNAPISLQALLDPDAGDFNRDAAVNSSDYSSWRHDFGSTEELAADGNANGIVDAADYVIWRKNAGGQAASAAIIQSAATAANTDSATVVEDRVSSDSTFVGVSSIGAERVAHLSRSIPTRVATDGVSPSDAVRAQQTSLLQIVDSGPLTTSQNASSVYGAGGNPVADLLYSTLEASERLLANLDWIDDEFFADFVDAAMADWRL
jgi:glucose/arabinose dehydrogenase